MRQSSPFDKVPVTILPPDRRYGEQLGWNLFERGRSALETGLLDVAFVLDSLLRFGEVGFSRVPHLAGCLIRDPRFHRFAAVWGSLAFLLSL